MDPNRNNTVCCQNLAEDSLKAYDNYHQTFIQNIFGTFMTSNSWKLG